MKTILIFASTVDGKITKWGNPQVRAWTSAEDKAAFGKVWNESRVVILGSNAFTHEKIRPSPARLLVVMTRYPQKYREKVIPGQVEFTDDPPSRIVTRFRNEGLEQMLVAGGPHIATRFLRDKLIDELWITFEPEIFGTGGNFVLDEQLEISLRLLTCDRVNERGTLIAKYAVLKDD